MTDELFESLVKQGKPKTGACLFLHKTAIKLRFIYNIIRSIVERNSYKILKLLFYAYLVRKFIQLLTYLIY